MLLQVEKVANGTKIPVFLHSPFAQDVYSSNFALANNTSAFRLRLDEQRRMHTAPFAERAGSVAACFGLPPYLRFITQCIAECTAKYHALNIAQCVRPDDLPEFKIKEYEPIFSISQIISVPIVNKSHNYELKFIGEGSYAKVFKYKDF